MPPYKLLTTAAVMENRTLPLFDCDYCGRNHSASVLPCQKYFLERHLFPAHPETVLPSDGTECGICLEKLSLPTSATEAQYFLLSEKVVLLIPCGHFFHKDCILAWHSSIRPERDTCPICRRTLFIADPLTPTQLELLQEYDLDHTHSILEEPEIDPAEEHSVWVVMNGEYMTMDVVAGLVIQQQMDLMNALAGRFHWYEVCKSIHNVMLAINGPLRPVFETHKDTFVLCVHCTAALISIGNSNLQMERLDRRDFLNWLQSLLMQVGGELVEELCVEMERDGLFVRPLLPIVAAPWEYQDQSYMNSHALRNILEAVMELRRDTGLRATLRRIARKLWPRRRT
jgi:hypothetical protein